jgi:serine/threonine protein kinase/formylglycine-generating enzyme required for sulfatase activity
MGDTDRPLRPDEKTISQPQSVHGPVELVSTDKTVQPARESVPAADDVPARLADSLIAAWAAESGVSAGTIADARSRCRAGGPRLHEALAGSGHVSLEALVGLLDDEVGVECEGCRRSFPVGASLVRFLPLVECPACGKLLRATDADRTIGDAPKTVVRSARAVDDDDGRKTVQDVTRTVGPYELRRRLGSGGMADVHVAAGPQGELVALKVLAPNLLDDASLKRFEREWKVCAELDHPNIVRVVGHGIDGASGRPYIAFELVDGRDLAAIVEDRRDQRLTAIEAVHVLLGCARGLIHAHGREILHRDVKPSNVLITTTGQVKLADFGVGLAENVSVRLTAMDQLLGTPQYLAPEVVTSSDWSRSADLYALGALAFRLLSGRTPFESPNVVAMLRAHVEQPAPSLSEVAPGTPPEIAALVARLLDKNPVLRPSADEVVAALEAIVSDTSAGARRLAAEAGAQLGGSPGAASERTLIAGQDFFNYRIDAELGRGGMGIVYKAFHLGLKKAVALKVLPPGAISDETTRLRFLREAESAAALKHPSIVPVLDVGEYKGTYYLTLELVNGAPIGRWLKEHEPDTATLLRTFAKVCDAVHHAHTRGVIHRDLKPDNVLVDAAGDPHVLDFGIAKRVDDDPTRANITTEGDIIGTVRYMPPEQAAGKNSEVDVRSDVYALGSMLYEMVTRGRTPFEGSVREILHQIHFGTPRPPSLTASGVPWELDAICLKCLEKERDERYQSALELKRDVERFLEGVPIQAKRATLRYRVLKWVSRNKRKAAAIAAIALVVVGLAAALVFQEHHREQKRVAGIVSGAREGWTSFARRAFGVAAGAFRAAEASATVDDVIPLPREVAGVMPAEVMDSLPAAEREHPRATRQRLHDWADLAARRMDREQVTRFFEAADRALAARHLDEAREAIQTALKLDPADASAQKLAARIGQEFAQRGEGALASLAKRAAADIDGRRSDLAAAQAAFEAARSLDPRSEPAVAGLASVAAERGTLAEHEARAKRSREAQERFEQGRAAFVAAEDLARVGSDEAAHAKLTDARRHFDAALDRFPELEAAKDLKVRVAIRLGELALKAEKVEVAEEELGNARAYDRLPGEIATFDEKLRALDRRTRAFHEAAKRGDGLYQDRDYTGAVAAYDLALAEKADPVVTRKRELCQVLVAAERARTERNVLAEYTALAAAQRLIDDPRALDGRIAPLAEQLHVEALDAANRAYQEAARRSSGWEEVAALYEKALAFQPRSAPALRGHADALAERDRPEDTVLVSVPARLLATGAVAATIDESEAVRVYIERTEVTNEAFAGFVRAQGYAKRELWSEAGWSARAAFVDKTGKPGPSAWSDGGPPQGTEKLPVTGVSWYEADAFARWRGRRLPSEDEWLLAACFDPATRTWLRFPSGEGVPKDDGSLRDLRAAGSASFDVSPWGARDMGWNASEWVAAGEGGAVRGFSFSSFEADVAGGLREWRKTPRLGYRDEAVGFRCAKSVAPLPLQGANGGPQPR